MKWVLDSSVALKWYSRDADTPKALKLRLDFHLGIHEFLAPDILPAECGHDLVQAERRSVIGPGEAELFLVDLRGVRLPLHPSSPLVQRAAVIALSTQISFYASLYLALAERENCELLTAASKVIRNARKHFPFVIDFASIP
jgi:predicted nucleic acid-binding protein